MPSAPEIDTPAQAAAERLGDALLGTCNHAEMTPEWEEFSNDLEFCARLDSKVMCCEGCGWWVEAHEIDDAGNCEDCHEQSEDDDDDNGEG